MSEELSGWVYVDPIKVYQSEHRVKVTEGVFHYGILDPDQRSAHWSYDEGTGIPIVSNKELEDVPYNHIGDRKLTAAGEESGSETPAKQLNVPKEFFEPEDDEPLDQQLSKVDERAFISENERRHFVFNADIDMHKGDTRSVYLLTDDQITERLAGPDDWGDSFGSKPQFF